MASGAEWEFFDCMYLAKRRPGYLMREFSPEALVRGLTNGAHPCAGMQTAEALQAYMGHGVSTVTAPQFARLEAAGLCGALAEGIRNGYTISRKSTANCAMNLMKGYPWAVKGLLDAGIGEALVKFYDEAENLAEEMDSPNGEMQVDMFKGEATVEQVVKYAPRFAQICREASGMCASAVIQAATVCRCRSELGLDLVKFAVFTALDLEPRDDRAPLDTSHFECALALAVMVSPTLESPLDEEEDVADSSPDETDRRLALKLVKTAFGGDHQAVESLVKAIKYLELESGTDYMLNGMDNIDPAAVALYGPVRAMPQPQHLLETTEKRFLTLNALYDLFASLDLDTPSDFTAHPNSTLTRFVDQERQLPFMVEEYSESQALEQAKQAEGENLYKNGSLMYEMLTVDTIDIVYRLPNDLEAKALAYKVRDSNLAKKVKSNANNILENGDFVLAARLYRRALKLSPLNDQPLRANLYSNLAEAYLRAGSSVLATRAANIACNLGHKKSKSRLQRAKKLEKTSKLLDFQDTFGLATHRMDDSTTFIRFLTPDISPLKAAANKKSLTKNMSKILQETDQDRQRFASDVVFDPGCPEIMGACTCGNVRALKRCLRDGHDPNTPCMLGETPLMRAASIGHVDCVIILIAVGASATAVDSCGRTALTCLLDPKNVFYQQGRNADKRQHIERLLRLRLQQAS